MFWFYHFILKYLYIFHNFNSRKEWELRQFLIPPKTWLRLNFWVEIKQSSEFEICEYSLKIKHTYAFVSTELAQVGRKCYISYSSVMLSLKIKEKTLSRSREYFTII